MSKPRLLDLFCGEGGASVGYARAGFEVEGIDHDRARLAYYPFRAICCDALDYLEAFGHLYDAIHASPPCQLFSITRHSHSAEHPDLLAPTRELLDEIGVPYVIENVPGAPMISPITLCGASFGLTARDVDGEPLVLRRHRLFEASEWLWPVECECLTYKDHGYRVGGTYGGGSADREYARYVRRGGYTPGKNERAALLGVDWPMSLHGLSQCIPPAYTQYLGEQLLERLDVGLAA